MSNAVGLSVPRTIEIRQMRSGVTVGMQDTAGDYNDACMCRRMWIMIKYKFSHFTNA